jgi:hypothetical protein
MMRPPSLFQLMNQMFYGFAVALAYGAITSVAIWHFETLDVFNHVWSYDFVADRIDRRHLRPWSGQQQHWWRKCRL